MGKKAQRHTQLNSEQVEESLSKLSLYQQALSRCLQTLQARSGSEADNHRVLEEALRVVMEAFPAARLSLYQNLPGSGTVSTYTLVAEVCASDVPSRLNNHEEKPTFSWSHRPKAQAQALQAAEPWSRSIPNQTRLSPDQADRNETMLELTMPLHCDGHWWGFISVEHQRDWAEFEIDFLQNIALVFSSALRRWAVEAANKELQVFKALVDSSEQAIAISQPDRALSYVNPAYEQLFGRTSDEALLLNYRDYYPPESLEQLDRHAFPKLLRGETWEGEIDALDAAGRRFPLVHRSGAIKDEMGQVTRIFAIVSDSTPRRQAEAALKKREQFLRTIYEGVQISLFIVDVDDDGDFRYAGFNPANTAITGLTTEDVAGRRPEEIPGISAENAAALRANYNRCLQANDTIRYEEKLIINDKTTWWLTQLSPVKDEQGRVYQIIGSSLEITEQKRQEERLRLLESAVVQARDGVLITEAAPLDAPGPRIIYVNKAITRMTGHSAAEIIGQSPRLFQGDETDRATLDKVRQALADREPVRVELLNYRKDGVPFWVDLSIAPVFDDRRRLTHFTAVQRDITDLKQAEEQRGRQLRYTQALARCSQTLLASGGTAAENWDTLNQALAHLIEAVRVSRAYVFKNFHDPQDGFCSGIVAEATAPGIAPNLHRPVSQKIPWSTIPAENRRILKSGRPLGGPITKVFAAAPEIVAWLKKLSILSVQFFPIRFGGVWWGYVGFDDCEILREWDEQEVLLLGTAAEIIGNVLQRWQAEESLRTANRRLNTLHQATHAVAAAKLDRQQIYREIHAAVGQLMPAEVFFIDLINENSTEVDVVYMADRGGLWPEVPYELANSFVAYMMRRGRSLHIDDFSKFPKEEYEFEIVGDPEDTHSGLAVLLHGRERVLGVLFVQSYDRAAYTDADLEMLELLASHVAITLENVELYHRARSAAVDEERQRLARELHDAVTQTLFSASLIAEALPDAWQQDPARAQAGLSELRQLTRSALAEMRTLLLELRPSSLTEKPLADSLKYLTEAMLRRFKIDFELSVEGNSLLPPDLQIAVYRIVQEALNNIVKHAGANRVTINLVCRPERVELEICDNGLGFNPETPPPGHLGLGIMRERAEAVGAGLTITSRPGQGTKLHLTWAAP